MKGVEHTRIEIIDNTDRGILENIFQFYLYDMSEFTSSPTNLSGKFSFEIRTLDDYWKDTTRTPYWIKHKEKIAGFIFLRPYPFDQSVYDIEQFFIMRSHRRSGIGRLAFQKCLALYPGKWQIRALLDNKPAYKFWKRTISETTGQNFTSTEEMDRDLLMHFFRFEYPKT